MYTHKNPNETWGDGAYVVFRPEAKDSDLAAMDILESWEQGEFVGAIAAAVAERTRTLSPEFSHATEPIEPPADI
jgi:hypothetical protein